MNNIYIKIRMCFLMLSSLVITSCGDSFLNTVPTVDIPVEDFYTSEERLINSVMAAYQPLQWHDWAFGQYNPLMVLGDIMGEDLFPGGADANDNEHWHRMNNFRATNEYTPASLWLIGYSGLNRANIVVENKDNITGVSEEIKKRAYGEALTLRAYYYHLLWKFWGNIPYYKINPTQMPFLVDQLPADEVYTLIIEDLDEVINNNLLPETVKVSETGRMTSAVAKMLKANVVLYQQDEGKYGEVLNDLRTIISSNIYTLHSNFAQIWEVAGEWCSESIFEVNYTDDPSNRSWDNPLGTGGCVTPTLIGISGLSGSKDYKGGWGFGAVSEQVYNLYQEGDQRKDGGILNFEKCKELNPSASYSPRYQDTGLFVKKYLPRIDGNNLATGDRDLNFNNNYRVFRYAETLLLASELIIRTGGPQDEADKYLNLVRARAFNMDVDAPEFMTYKKTATLNNLFMENRLEFVGEGHRYWDIIRFGKAQEILGARGYTESKKHLPIPRSEIDKAQGTLIQNPY